MKNGRLVFVAATAVAVIQIGILVSMIAGRAAILRDGQEIVLEVQPVDPRDLLRGDYVVLGYNISLIAPDLLADSERSTENGVERAVYVRLAPDEDGIFQPVAARYDQRLEAEPGPGEVDIRGVVRYWQSSRDFPVPVEYGIERFYVPEGEGTEIELGMFERRFIMRVAVAANGAGQIKAFYDGDRLLYEEPWY